MTESNDMHKTSRCDGVSIQCIFKLVYVHTICIDFLVIELHDFLYNPKNIWQIPRTYRTSLLRPPGGTGSWTCGEGDSSASVFSINNAISIHPEVRPRGWFAQGQHRHRSVLLAPYSGNVVVSRAESRCFWGEQSRWSKSSWFE